MVFNLGEMVRRQSRVNNFLEIQCNKLLFRIGSV